MTKKIFRLIKDFLIYLRITQLLKPFSGLFNFLYNFNSMISWIYSIKQPLIINDFFTFKRDHKKRYIAFSKMIENLELKEKKIIYLEFGVASGDSFRWWLSNNTNADSRFIGFDTFEGLPEKWGMFFEKGDMKFNFPDITDKRGEFLRGLFQDTLHPYINNHINELKSNQLIIHLDADLFSATLFVLTQLYPYLKKGDIIMFDEFNVATHEYKAFKLFTTSFYVKMKPIYAVNNFYQTGFMVE